MLRLRGWGLVPGRARRRPLLRWLFFAGMREELDSSWFLGRFTRRRLR